MNKMKLSLVLMTILLLSITAIAIPVHADAPVIDHTPDWNPFTIELSWANPDFIIGEVDVVFSMAVSGYPYVGNALTLSGTIDMTARAEVIGWGIEAWACSYGDVKLTYEGDLLHYEASPIKWADGSHEAWWEWDFYRVPNDQSQTYDFSFDYIPTQEGTYTLKAFGHADAGYYTEWAKYEPWFPGGDYKGWLNKHATPLTFDVELLTASEVVALLLEEGVLNKGQANSLFVKIEKDNRTPFENQVNALCRGHILTTGLRDWLLSVEFE